MTFRGISRVAGTAVAGMVIRLRHSQGKPIPSGPTKPSQTFRFSIPRPCDAARVYTAFIATLKLPFKFDRP
jgi:hypothetical protein